MEILLPFSGLFGKGLSFSKFSGMMRLGLGRPSSCFFSKLQLLTMLELCRKVVLRRLSVLRVMKNVISPHNAFEMCTARPPHSTPDPPAQMFPMEDRAEDDGDRGCVWASLRSGISGETEEVMSVPCPTGEWVGGGGCLGNSAAPSPSPPCTWCWKWDSFQTD